MSDHPFGSTSPLASSVSAEPHAATDNPTASIAGSRMRCPHCHNPIEISDGRDEVLCPGCGGSFKLREARYTDTTSPSRQLGKFQLLDRVGVGGFGAVWKARDTELDRIVALKIPHTGQLIEKAELERFHREARSAAQLRHPGIVTVHEVVTLNGLPTIVADFIQGMTLKDLLEVRRLPFREAAQLVADVADALHYAHESGLVHRDVKPANIMLETSGVVSGGVISGKQTTAGGHSPLTTHHSPKLMDFGLALRDQVEVTMTLDGHVLGTPAYMSPEQAAGKSHTADRRSDVYSLGVILYELLAGELPFRGSKMMILHQVLHEEPRPPRKLKDKVPRDLETICLKALAKSPDRRYATACYLADDLRRFLNGEPIHARPIAAWERLAVWAKRRPAAAALLLVSVLAAMALAGLVVGFLYNDRLKQEIEAKTDAEAQTERALEVEKQAKANAEQAQNAESEQRQKAEAVSQELQKARERERFYLYVNRIRLAHSEWRDANVDRVEKLLDDCPEDLRGWEWHYLKRLCHADLFTMRGSTVAFSPDGKLLASGLDNGIKIWNLWNGKENLSFPGHPGGVRAVAFAPDGTLLASAGADQTVKIWDVRTGQETHTFEGHRDQVSSVAFSPDGKQLASGSADRTVRVWDMLARREISTLNTHSDQVRSVAYSPDGKRLASGSLDRTIKIWDVATGKETLTIRGHTSSVLGVAFSPDSKRIASTSGDISYYPQKSEVKVWDSQTGQEILTLNGHTMRVTSVAFSPDGSRLATASLDRTVKVWTTATGEELLTFRGHGDAVLNVAFSPEGMRLASASSDYAVKVWDAMTDQEALTFQGHNADARSVAFSPDGKQLASSSDDKTVKVWSPETGEEALTVRGHRDWVWSVAFSPDGTRLASSTTDISHIDKPAEVKVWDAHAGKEIRTLVGHSRSVQSVAFSPDGKTLASAGSDKTVKVWDLETGRTTLTLEGHSEPVNCVAFSPDGHRLASASGDRTVRVWDAKTGQVALTLMGHASSVHCVAFSPNGQQLATGSYANESTVKVWHATTGKETQTLKGHAFDVNSVAFSPDGTRLASASADQTVRLWDVQTGQLILTLKGHLACVHSVTFSPDGKRLASASRDQTVRIWDAGQPTPEVRAIRLNALTLRWNLKESERRAQSHLKLGQWDKAAADYSTVIELDPKNAGAWHQRAHAYENMHEWERAFADFSRGIELLPDNATFWRCRGMAYMSSGQWDKAIADFSKLIEMQPTNAEIWNLRALSHFRLGRCDRALADLSKALELKPDLAIAQNNRAWILATASDPKLRDPKEAVLLAKKAAEREPENVLFSTTLGVAQYRAGDWQSATAALEKSIKLLESSDKWDWSSGRASIFLAMAHWQSGHKEDARQWYNRGIQWTEKNGQKLTENKQQAEELGRFRSEAAALLGIDGPLPAK